MRRFLSNYFDLLSAYCRARDIDIAILSVSPSVDGVCPLSPVHTGDKVEFNSNTVDFVESRQSRPCCCGPVHTGNKVDRISNKVERIGNKVDRDKLSNSSCCRFVAKTGNKVERIRQQSTLLPICCRFRQQSTFNKIDGVQFNFVASKYRA